MDPMGGISRCYAEACPRTCIPKPPKKTFIRNRFSSFCFEKNMVQTAYKPEVQYQCLCNYHWQDHQFDFSVGDLGGREVIPRPALHNGHREKACTC